MINFVGKERVYTVKQVLQRFLVVGVGDVDQRLHLLLELVPQEPVVDANNSADINVNHIEATHIFRVEPRLDQIHAGNVPLLVAFTLLQTDIPAGLQLSDQFMYTLIRSLIKPLLQAPVNIL